MRIIIIPSCFAACILTGKLLSAQTPLTMEQAIKEAMEKNLTLAAEKLNIRVAEARQITAALRPNPVLSLSADHLDILGSGYTRANGAGPTEVALRTDFVLERGKKRENRIAVASSEKTLAEVGVREIMRHVIIDAQNAYVDVQQAKDSLALAQNNLKSLNGIVEVNTARVKSGDLAPVELSRSQVAALQYENSVRQGELQLRQAKTKLSLALGRAGSPDDLDVVGELRRDPDTINLPAIREKAVLLRPDLAVVQRTQARSQADLRLQLSNGKIDYTVGSEYRRQQGVNGTANSMGFFFSAPLPVFNKNQGEIARATREIDLAAGRIKAMQASIENEVQTAYNQYSTSKTMLEDIETRMLSKATDVRSTMEYSYRRGEASLVEFLDAQRAFNDAQQSYSDAKAAYARSLYLLDAVSAASVSGDK